MVEKLNDVLFYTIENSIKAYRQYAQRNINEAGFAVTIDQWLVLKALKDNPSFSQKQIASTVFKDHASLTRIIELLVQKRFLSRNIDTTDRRRFQLLLTNDGEALLISIQPLINKNRIAALSGIEAKQAEETHSLLNQIIRNCTL